MSQVFTAERHASEQNSRRVIGQRWSIILALGGWDDDLEEARWGGRCLAECNTMVDAAMLVDQWAIGAPLCWPDECSQRGEDETQRNATLIVATNPEGRRVIFVRPAVLH